MKTFETLSKINVNEHTEKKNGLTYLSWAWAWAEVKKQCSDANYSIDYYDGKPYLFDENLGYIVSTKVKIEGETIPMHLPVMDGANKAMIDRDYTYTTKYGKKTCAKASMFDINKTIMRCLVKNLAMFGLGLYIYAGEDLPSEEKEKEEQPTRPEPKSENFATLLKLCSSATALQTAWGKVPNKFKPELTGLKDELKSKLK